MYGSVRNKTVRYVVRAGDGAEWLPASTKQGPTIAHSYVLHMIAKFYGGRGREVRFEEK